MRLLGAGLFVFLGLAALIGLLGSVNAFEHAPGWLMALVVLPSMAVLVGISLRLFNKKGALPRRQNLEEQVREMERLGLLESRTFHATRAFGVEEFEDEGLHYYIELADGSVLYLSGQYLYDYEPITGDPELNQPRSFPCSEFTVRRHKEAGYVVDIICAGSVLEPEGVSPSFGKDVWRAGRVPGDGQIITAATYDDLKRARFEAGTPRGS